MQEKWETSSYFGHSSLPSDVSKDKEWIAQSAETQKKHIEYWKEINPKNKKQLVQFITRACVFNTFNYIAEPFSTKELRCAYEMYMDQNVVHSKTKLGFFILGQFNAISEKIKKAQFPKHIKTFKDLTKTTFGPELYNALSRFAREIDQYEKYNENWQDYIPLEIALQKRVLKPTNIEVYSHQSWQYQKGQYETQIYRSFREQDQAWKFIGLITRETKHKMDVKWTNSPWHKEIQLEQKLLGN
jgi:hypothetical protein